MIKSTYNKSAKKYVTIIFLCFLGIPNAHSQETNYDDLNLKGTVKSCTQKEYWVTIDDSGNISKTELAWNEYEILKFNQDGFVTEENYNNSNDKLIKKTLNHYSQSNKLINSVFTDSENIKRGEYVFKYDARGNKIQFNHYIKEGILLLYKEYEYDTNNHMTTMKRYYSYDSDVTEADSIPTITKYKYDDVGNKIEEIDYDKEGLFSSKTLYNYDNNKVSEMIGYDENDHFSYKTTYGYDSMNSEIEIKIYIEMPPIEETETIVKNGVEYTQVTLYTTDDLYLEEQTTYSITYDSKGNWIRKVEFRDEEPHKITEREIVYYQ